ncbi:MAG: hypothetical protein N3B12_06700, partial [Armatimonadetes bacterium]|nr:hypothetical protein [Armatimonadota bacterium]
LDDAGLKSNSAVIKLVPKSVIEAVTTVSVSGVFSGTGIVPLGDLRTLVKFAISKESFTLSGSSTVQARTDTPLATYTFSGELKLEASNAKMWLTAAGSIQRTGKLTNQVSNTQISDVPVNISDGTATVNVEGVPVTFVLFKP